MTTINMQKMRYLNLFDKVSRVKTSKCFNYNNMIIFAVSSEFISKAIGPSGRNIREIQELLGKKVKIIREAKGLADAKRFVEDVVNPATFKSLDVNNGEFVLTAGSMSKASLIGRNKKRLEELSEIMQDNFGMQLRII